MAQKRCPGAWSLCLASPRERQPQELPRLVIPHLLTTEDQSAEFRRDLLTSKIGDTRACIPSRIALLFSRANNDRKERILAAKKKRLFNLNTYEYPKDETRPLRQKDTNISNRKKNSLICVASMTPLTLDGRVVVWSLIDHRILIIASIHQDCSYPDDVSSLKLCSHTS